MSTAMANKQNIFVTGGSRGLGKELAKVLAEQGADLTVFARTQRHLEKAKGEILAARLSTDQRVNAVPLDVADPSEVETVFRSQQGIADSLYCVAGGSATECGFLANIGADALESCMRSNYFTCAYAAQAMLKLWIEDDERTCKRARPQSGPKHRQIIFVSSSAAFVGLPGYIAYTPAKCAVRALADTLRSEVLRYSGKTSTYSIHCAFPSNFVSAAFVDEQKNKPELTKKIEGTTGPISEVMSRLPCAKRVAECIIAKVERGDFAITCGDLESALLFANMRGPSPKRGFGVVDSLLGALASVIWPIVRRRLDSMCKQDAKVLDGATSCY